MTLVQPTNVAPILPFVTTWGQYCMGIDARLIASGGPVSTVWPTIRKVFYVPLYLPVACITSKFWWVNGTAVSGNVDCGIYTSLNGLPATKIASTGSTAQAGISGIQSVSVVRALAPGKYFLALVVDNTTATIHRLVGGNSTLGWKMLGYCEETLGAMPLPTTATPVVQTVDRGWFFGFSTVALV